MAWTHVSRRCRYCGEVGPRVPVPGGYAHKRCMPSNGASTRQRGVAAPIKAALALDQVPGKPRPLEEAEKDGRYVVGCDAAGSNRELIFVDAAWGEDVWRRAEDNELVSSALTHFVPFPNRAAG